MRRNNRNYRNVLRHKNEERNFFRIVHILIFLIFLFVIIFAFIFIFDFFKHNNNDIILSSDENNDEIQNTDLIESNEPVESEKESKDITFKLTAIGDVMCHNTQYWDAYDKNTGEYDFSYVFEDIKYYTSLGDVTIGSLETSFAGADRGYSNYPTFNSPDALAYAFKKIGVNILSTAGNHCLDMGYSGLCRTIDVLDNASIFHLGTYKSQEEQDNILIKSVRGVNVAFINYTYGTNGISVPEGKEYCVNLIDKDLIKKHIDSAKEKNADVIIACMHWGTEYKTTANDEQKDLANFLFQNGVDIILGNHPHVLEPMEKRIVTLEDGAQKECFVIYALGNFICDQRAENTRNSIILNLLITKHSDGRISIDSADYVPIHMYSNPSLSLKKFKVLDIEKTIAEYESGEDTSIGLTKYNDLVLQLQKIKNIVGEEF